MNSIIRPLLISLLIYACTSTPGLSTSVATPPIADAFVAAGPTGNLANNNYGGGNALALAAPGLTNGEFQTVMKFDFSALKSTLDAQFGLGQWSVQSVSLQLISSPHNNVIYNDIAPGTFGISLMQNNSWIEGTGTAGNPANNGITYNTLLSSYIDVSSDQSLGNFSFQGGASGTNSYALSLSSDLNNDILTGTLVTLRLYGVDSQVSYLFSARTSGAGSPEFIVNASAVPEPDAIALCAFSGMVLFLRRKANCAP